MQKALKGEPSPEVRRGVEELIGNDEAKTILRHVAEEGAPESELTRQAKATLERLDRRAP